MKVPKHKIAIISTVANFDLYDKTSMLFPEGIQKYVIDGTQGLYGIDSIFYMLKKFKNLDFDWLIMVDEDVIFKSPELIFDLINEMNTNDYFVAGVRDGGVVSHRNQNPHSINTFFSVLNISKIRNKWNKKAILKHQSISKDEFETNLQLPYDFNELSLFEPYYCFYFWLRRNGFKIKFLDTIMLDDHISNKVLINGETIAYHSWYARQYGKNKNQTERINKLINNQNTTFVNTSSPIIYRDKFFQTKNKIRKFVKRVKLKLNIL